MRVVEEFERDIESPTEDEKLKTYQGLGIGKQLFDFAKYHIYQSGHDHFVLCCNKYNKGAQAFYQKMGCQVVSIDDDNEDKSIPQVNFVYHY